MASLCLELSNITFMALIVTYMHAWCARRAIAGILSISKLTYLALIAVFVLLRIFPLVSYEIAYSARQAHVRG